MWLIFVTTAARAAERSHNIFKKTINLHKKLFLRRDDVLSRGRKKCNGATIYLQQTAAAMSPKRPKKIPYTIAQAGPRRDLSREVVYQGGAARVCRAKASPLTPGKMVQMEQLVTMHSLPDTAGLDGLATLSDWQEQKNLLARFARCLRIKKDQRIKE